MVEFKIICYNSDNTFERGEFMRLLVAEDEKDLARGITAILEYNHYAVDTVHDGEDVLFYAESTDYDGIILDIMMPKKSGLEVLEALRKRGNKTAILLLTAKNQIEDKVTGLDLGADDYLTKPFDMKELLARVRSMLRRPNTFVHSDIEFADLTLNRDRITLACNGQEVSLNNREFQLMEMFLLNSEQVLSKELIMERIWGLDSEAEINVVWVNISSLRKKLQTLQSIVKISASRGLGYKLEVSHD